MEEERYSFEDAVESFQDDEVISLGITAPPIAGRSFVHEIDEEYSSDELLPHHVINIIAEEEEGEGENGGGSIGRGASYIPHLVSIGPNHYGNPKLSAMQTHKTEILESRKWNSQMEPSLKNALLGLEERARKCYPHNFNHMDGDTFVKMMLIDAFFLINLFTDYDNFCKGDGELPNNFVFTTRWRLPTIFRDLLMLENQLPFFILAKVYVILTNNESVDCLKKLALQFLKQVQFGKVAVMVDDNSIPENPKHLLDLFHNSFVQMDRGEGNTSASSSRSLETTGTKIWVKSASTLKSNGVTFIAREGGRPLDIEFSWLGRLRIPTFYIDARNISVLKNLLAYEQGSCQVKPYFTSLAVFFSNIAATPGDVKFLREAGIIQHQPGNDQMVVLLLRKLYKAVEYSSDHECLIKSEVERINRYVTSVSAGKLISYTKTILLANFVPFVVLFVAVLLSLSPDTLKRFRIRV